MAAAMDSTLGTSRHHNQRRRSVGARTSGTAPQTWKEDKADSFGGSIREAGRRSHDRHCLQKAQQNVPRNEVFGSDPWRCGGCDRCAETEKHGGRRERSVGHRSKQCVWQHVETVCVGTCADSLPPDAGNIVHALGKREVPQLGCKQRTGGPSGTGIEARGRARLLPTPLTASHCTKRCWKQGRRPRVDKTTRQEGKEVN